MAENEKNKNSIESHDSMILKNFRNNFNELVVSYQFDWADEFYEGVARVRKNGKYFYIDEFGERISQENYDYAMSFSEQLAAVEINGLWGYISLNGRIVIPLIYEHAEPFSNGFAVVQKNIINSTSGNIGDNVNKCIKYGFIDRYGNSLTEFKYDFAESFSDERARVAYLDDYYGSSEYGFIDTSGNEVIPLKYRWAQNFSEGLAFFHRTDDYRGYVNGYINYIGEEVIQLDLYDDGGEFREGYAEVHTPSGFSYSIDKNGNIFNCDDFRIRSGFINGIAIASKNEKWGLIDNQCNIIVDFNYYEIIHSSLDGIYIAKMEYWDKNDAKWGLIDISGNRITGFIFDEISKFSEGFAVFKLCGHYGYINKKGIVVIDPLFNEAEPFNEGIACVKRYGSYGVIDKLGRTVIDFIYESRINFSCGRAEVFRNLKHGEIDQNGNEIVSFPKSVKFKGN